MAGVNKVILVGNLGADPEARSLNNGGEVVNMRVATSESWKDKNTGEKKERTEWHSIVVWNDGLVGVIDKYVKKVEEVVSDDYRGFVFTKAFAPGNAGQTADESRSRDAVLTAQ